MLSHPPSTGARRSPAVLALSMLGRTALGLLRAESTVSPELKQIKRARGLGTAARLFVASATVLNQNLQLEGQPALAAEPDCLILVLKKPLLLLPLKLRGSHTHDSREVKLANRGPGPALAVKCSLLLRPIMYASGYTCSSWLEARSWSPILVFMLVLGSSQAFST